MSEKSPTIFQLPDPATYLVMQQMGLIKKTGDGKEYIIVKTERDADGDGKIAPREKIGCAEYGNDSSGKWGCLYNGFGNIWNYYAGNLKYFDKGGVKKATDKLKSELKDGIMQLPLHSGDEYAELFIYGGIMALARIGMVYPKMVEDFVPILGAALNSHESWFMEAAINALGWIGINNSSLVKAYVPRLAKIEAGKDIIIPNTERAPYLTWLACISLNEIAGCSSNNGGPWDNMAGCEVTEEKPHIGCAKRQSLNK